MSAVSPFAQLMPDWRSPMRASKHVRSQSVDKDALHAYRMTGKTIKQCAKHFGCSRRTVEEKLSHMPKVVIARGVKRFNVDVKKIIEQHKAGMTSVAIAAHHGVGIQVVRSRLADAGLFAKKRIGRSEPVKGYVIRLTMAQRAHVMEHGGAAFLRSLIDKHMEAA